MRWLAGGVLQLCQPDLLGALLQLLPIEGVGDLHEAMVVGHRDGGTLGSGQEIGLTRHRGEPPLKGLAGKSEYRSRRAQGADTRVKRGPEEAYWKTRPQ
jgi:hypothetical protein